MSIIYKPHVCDTPVANTDEERARDGIPIYYEGTLWECKTCGRHWRYVIGGYYWLGEWRRVRFWNLIAKHRIRKAAQTPPQPHP